MGSVRKIQDSDIVDVANYTLEQDESKYFYVVSFLSYHIFDLIDLLSLLATKCVLISFN